MNDQSKPESAAWCVVANVVHEHQFGEEQKVLKGTKHFAPGAKVYCVIFRSDRQHPQVEVVGRHRKSKRYIKIWMRLSHLANWRVELVYSPTIIKFLTNYAYSIRYAIVQPKTEASEGIYQREKIYSTWDDSEESKRKAEEIVSSLSTKFGAGNQPYSTREKNENQDH